MSFFKDFKEDLSMAVNELVLDEEALAKEEGTLEKGSEKETDEAKATEAPVDNSMDVNIDMNVLNGLLQESITEELIEEPLEKKEEIEDNKKQKNGKDTINEVNDNEMKNENTVDDIMSTKTASEEVAQITKGTTIKGDISSDGSIDLSGKVEGNVSCNGKLLVTGTIIGESLAAEVYANNASIEGNVVSEGSVKIGNGSVVKGNIEAASAVIAGAVNGDIDVKGPVIVDATAVVMGNIKSRSVQINNGAVIEGFCSQCYSEIDVKTFFDQK